jgi:hypothetical protein
MLLCAGGALPVVCPAGGYFPEGQRTMLAMIFPQKINHKKFFHSIVMFLPR